MIERHDAAIDLGAATAMPDLGMYVIGKVEHGATARQVDHLATRREHVHPILDQIAAQPGDKGAVIIAIAARSEEHTSELQSLMRISYAVFCLKTKTLYEK